MKTFQLSTATLGVAMLAVAGASAEEPSKQAQIEDALSAAPPAVRETAKVIDGQGNVLKEGSGPYVCMPTSASARERGRAPICVDEVWMKLLAALKNKEPFSTDQVGISYMLAGDAGASNIDPYAKGPTADNQWVVEGPHLMILAPDPAQLEGLPTTPDTEGAYVMWPSTPYAHIMIPTGPRPEQPSVAQK